jgi:hypothetical protein
MLKYQTTLLFNGTLVGDEQSLGINKKCISVNEIFFRRPVSLHQIKIIKTNHLYHPDIRGQLGQTTPEFDIKDFQIFGKNLNRPADKYELLVSENLINMSDNNDDVVFPLNLIEFTTNKLYTRGIYKNLSISIYGIILDELESTKVLEHEYNTAIVDVVIYDN